MDELDPSLEQALAEADERHSREPDMSFAEYRNRKYQELARFVTQRKPVYLDMNFWIWIRNPSETKKPAAAQRLLALLRDGVKDARFLCPVSYAVFLELMKQPPERRLTQARIMDELSQGIGIRNRFDTAEIEYLQFFARHLPLPKGAKIDPVWAPVGHLIGEKYNHDVFPHAVMERGRKVMLDVTWAVRMEHYAELRTPLPPGTIADKVNAEHKLNPRNGKTFERLFAEELDGALDAMSPHIENAIKEIARQLGRGDTGGALPERERRALVNLIREAVTQGRDITAIPSQRIHAALHAAMRLDDRRDLKENDLDDFRHASVATAYCDIFLTEKPLAHTLRLPSVMKVIPHHCTVTSDLDEAISVLTP